MATKKIPKSMILKHFFSLPEEQRVRILQRHLHPDVIESYAGNNFYPVVCDWKVKPKKEVMATLKKLYGDSRQHLRKTVQGIEDTYLGLLAEREYAQFQASTDEEKLYAQVCCETMNSRVRAFYGYLNDKDKQPYIRAGLSEMITPQAAIEMEKPRLYAPGKSQKSFLDDVMKTMDLSKEKSSMEHLRTIVPADDPERKEKMQCLAQQYMIYSDSVFDPEALAGKINGKGWKKNFDTQKIMKTEDSGARLHTEALLQRIKSAVNEVPETEEEKRLFREAALQTCRDFKRFRQLSPKSSHQEDLDFLKYTDDLAEEVAKDGLSRKDVQDTRTDLTKEYNTLQKDKRGWFLSRTNSPEYNEMMQHLKLFQAKLDIMEGGKPRENLTDEEMKTVNGTSVNDLFANAKQGCYNYGTLKTKSGTGSIWHEAGNERFDSSMKTISKLGELGKKLHLSDTATALRDDVQMQVLQHRKDEKWLSENIENAVVKTICAQSAINSLMPEYQQQKALEGNALQKQMDNIKSQDAYKNIMKNVSKEALADALIKGGNSLYEVMLDAQKKEAAAEKKTGDPEIAPAVKQQKGELGLTAGMR